ncbi:hypothetical protein ACFXJ8_16225 [Nonomuraea sp. NPDC059194]|uniref:hypothetical protein n=1 Tax=Nonomuraea sp. NPDC059194 TaxID=3346764 RepID=UPI0036AED72B
MTELVARLTSDEHGFVAVLPELDGVEGFGTTALAAAACHIPEVVEHFGDGIDWLTVGAATPRVVESLVRVRLASFGVPWISADAEAEFEEPGTGLLVLDGVRTAEQLRACLSLTSGVTVLVTARTADILPGLPSIIRLKVPDGGWPLLARLSGSLGTAVDDAFDLADPAARACAVQKVLDAGLPSLSPGALPRLLELSAFAADSDIPASVVPAVWQRTAGLSKGEAERLLTELSEAGLAVHHPDRDLLLVPDVVRDYLRQASSGEVVSRTARALIDSFTDAARTNGAAAASPATTARAGPGSRASGVGEEPPRSANHSTGVSSSSPSAPARLVIASSSPHTRPSNRSGVIAWRWLSRATAATAVPVMGTKRPIMYQRSPRSVPDSASSRVNGWLTSTAAHANRKAPSLRCSSTASSAPTR